MMVGEDFKTFLTFLEDSLNKTDREARFMEGPSLHRNQGKAITLDEILAMCRDSSKTLAARKGL